MSQKNVSKHDIKEDNFVTSILRSWEYIREHQNAFFSGLIVLIVIIAGSIWIGNSRSQAKLNAEAQFAEALSSFRSGQVKSAEEIFKLVNERYGGSEIGSFSIYYLGVCSLLDGRNTEAIENFQKYLDKAGKYPFFRDAAMDGMGTAFENERDFGRAGEIYLELASSTKTNEFNSSAYLRKAADNLKLANENGKAIEALERLLEMSTGIERRDIETELAILRG